jgi:Circadian oscillating protein COP23
MKFQWLISLSCLAVGMVILTSEAQAGRIPVLTRPGSSSPPVQPTPPRVPVVPPVQNPPVQQPVQPPAITTVRCIGRVTMAEKNGRQSPVITWSTNYFGDNYTPETRCQMVSPKLNNAVAANGGTFKGMRFESGPVNGQLVVCALGTGQSQCTSSNMLFTLKPENRPRVVQILQELTNFGVSASSSIVEDSGEGVQVDISDLDQELEGSTPSDAPQPSQSAPPVVDDTGF